MTFKNLLVHVDDDAGSAARLDAAIKLARDHEAHLTSLYVQVEPSWPGYVQAQMPEEVLKIQESQLIENAMEVKRKVVEVIEKSGLSADHRNRVWVACFGSAELVAIDRDSYEPVVRHKLDSQPLNILVHPVRNIVYAALPRENAVAEIDLETGTILRKIPGGIEPDGLRWGR